MAAWDMERMRSYSERVSSVNLRDMMVVTAPSNYAIQVVNMEANLIMRSVEIVVPLIYSASKLNLTENLMLSA